MVIIPTSRIDHGNNAYIVKSIPIDSDLFTSNRNRLTKLLPRNSLALVNANDVFPTNADGTMSVPNSDLFYLAGVAQEESILLLAPDTFDEKNREILFLRESTQLLATWDGHKLTKEQARTVSGIKNIQWLSEYPAVFHALMCEAEQVFLNTNEHQRAVVEVETRDTRFIRQCQRRYPLHQYRRLAPLLHQLRTVKSATDLALIKNACD